jgi:hypothetical protein
MEVFGEVDKNKKGLNASEYPAWYFDRHVEELEESIASLERSLNMGLIPADKVPAQKQDVANKKEKLHAILKSKPKPSVAERDKLWKLYKSLGEKIGDSMYTRSEMHMGTVDAHTEASFMTKPCITLNPEEASMAKSCGIKMGQDRKVSRNQAAKPFKILGKLLGEPSNIEVLRRDKVVESNATRQAVAA